MKKGLPNYFGNHFAVEGRCARFPHQDLQSPRPATGVFRARSVSGVCPRKRGCPRECPKGCFGAQIGDTSGTLPRHFWKDSCSRSGGFPHQRAIVPNAALSENHLTTPTPHQLGLDPFIQLGPSARLQELRSKAGGVGGMRVPAREGF